VDRLILVRHAETTYNARGLMNPDSRAEAGLSTAGLRAALDLRMRLLDEPIEIAIVTTRLRTTLTAEALVGDDIPLMVLDELAEIGVGCFEGRPVSEYRAWIRANSLRTAPLGGESVADAAARYLAGLRRIRELPGGLGLAVMHNLPMRMTLNAAAGSDPIRGDVQRVPNADRFDLSGSHLDAAIARLSAWLPDI
jgi:broad specificity phosphatase PhoE